MSGIKFGIFDFEVINPTTGNISFVHVEKETEPGFVFLTSEAVPATTAQKEDFNVVMQLFNAEVLVPLLPKEGTESFALYTNDGVSAQIATSEAVFLAGVNLRRFNIFTALKMLFGRLPIAVVVFPNGDVAKFKIMNPAGGALCCEYVSGSARNSKGEFIPDSELGGNGVESGGEYVIGTGSGGSTTEILFEIHLSNQSWSCATVGGIFLGCERI